MQLSQNKIWHGTEVCVWGGGGGGGGGRESSLSPSLPPPPVDETLAVNEHYPLQFWSIDIISPTHT